MEHMWRKNIRSARRIWHRDPSLSPQPHPKTDLERRRQQIFTFKKAIKNQQQNNNQLPNEIPISWPRIRLLKERVWSARTPSRKERKSAFHMIGRRRVLRTEPWPIINLRELEMVGSLQLRARLLDEEVLDRNRIQMLGRVPPSPNRKMVDCHRTELTCHLHLLSSTRTLMCTNHRVHQHIKRRRSLTSLRSWLMNSNHHHRITLEWSQHYMMKKHSRKLWQNGTSLEFYMQKILLGMHRRIVRLITTSAWVKTTHRVLLVRLTRMGVCKDLEENVMILFMKVSSRIMSITVGADTSAIKEYIGVTSIWVSDMDKESGSALVATRKKEIGLMEYSSEDCGRNVW